MVSVHAHATLQKRGTQKRGEGRDVPVWHVKLMCTPLVPLHRHEQFGMLSCCRSACVSPLPHCCTSVAPPCAVVCAGWMAKRRCPWGWGQDPKSWGAGHMHGGSAGSQGGSSRVSIQICSPWRLWRSAAMAAATLTALGALGAPLHAQYIDANRRTARMGGR